MGTESAHAGRCALALPWDVPVRLVPGGPSRAEHDAVRSPARARFARLGVPLPGVEGVLVGTVTFEGREVLRSIDPVATAVAVAAPVPDGTGGVPLDGLLAGLSDDGAVPVLIEGTPFTRAVLAALLEVGPGQRCTYAELAARAGRPRAVRAAAHVMATNRVPLVLPCHRVVPASGGTGRYGWGAAVKAALLEHETLAARGAAPFSG